MQEFPLTPLDPMGLPASVAFILFFKVLGFVLHMIPMNIWYAGVPLSIVLGVFARGNLQRVGFRLMYAMPILIALGINFGIIALLFIQIIYYPQFYTAGILIAWPWFFVIVFLIFAYYGVYIYSAQIKRGHINKLGYLSGGLSAILFLVIGFLFTNNFSLMTNARQMLNIYEKTNIGGAVTGLALNFGDPTLLPRWLLMLGIAITTTSVWLLIDRQFFCSTETEEYRNFVPTFVAILYTLGILWMGISGSWYIWGALPESIFKQAMNIPWVKSLFAFAGVSAIFPWLWILIRRNSMSLSATWIAAGLQLMVIVSNALSRQWVQIAEISRFMPITRDPVNWQWSPLIVFLVLFVLGLGVIVWMLKKIIALPRKASIPVK